MLKLLKFITLVLTINLLLPFIAFSQEEEEYIPPFDYRRDFSNILERTKNRFDSLYYPSLLTRFLDNDPNMRPDETLALMIGFTNSRFYKPYEDMNAELELIKLNDKAFYLDAIDETKNYLKTHPLSLSINKERSYAYYMLKKKDSAKYFMQLADKLMEAMIYSGKGRTAETAFFSLGLVDGDYFIPNVGLSIWGKGTGKDRYNNYMYTIDAVDLKDVHKTYYFNIQHAKKKMDQDEADDKIAAMKKPRRTKGKQIAAPDSIPFNPADSVVLPFNERPVIIDSTHIKDSIRTADSLRIDSIRLDSIRITDSLRNDSIRIAQEDSLQKANLPQISLETNAKDSLTHNNIQDTAKTADHPISSQVTDSLSKNPTETDKESIPPSPLKTVDVRNITKDSSGLSPESIPTFKEQVDSTMNSSTKITNDSSVIEMESKFEPTKDSSSLSSPEKEIKVPAAVESPVLPTLSEKKDTSTADIEIKKEASDGQKEIAPLSIPAEEKPIPSSPADSNGTSMPKTEKIDSDGANIETRIDSTAVQTEEKAGNETITKPSQSMSDSTQLPALAVPQEKNDSPSPDSNQTANEQSGEAKPPKEGEQPQ
jgi:hypothetical protein